MIFFLQDNFWVCQTINCQIYNSSYFSDLKSFVLIKGVVFDHNKKIIKVSPVWCHVSCATCHISEKATTRATEPRPPAPSQVSSVTYQVLGAMCQVSGVPCQVSCVTCQESGVMCQWSQDREGKRDSNIPRH